MPVALFFFHNIGPMKCEHSHIESSHSLRQNDVKLQTHAPSILIIKMSNLPKIDVYNFKYKFSVRNIMKLFFLSHKCIDK